MSEIIHESALPEVTSDLVSEVTDAIMRRGFELPQGDDGEIDEDYVHYAILGALDEISVAMVGDELPIFRAIEIANIKQLNLVNLGIYWTTNPALAHPYNGGDGMFWLTIEAAVKVTDVDWASVLAVHLEGGESEITLSEGTPIRIVMAKWVSHKTGYKLPAPPRGLAGKMARA